MSYDSTDGYDPDDDLVVYPLPTWTCCTSQEYRHLKNCIRDKSQDYTKPGITYGSIRLW